jgi:protein-arginine kinase activator protein McsA
MRLKSRVIFEVVDEETEEIVSRDELLSLVVDRPSSIDDIGLNASTQHQLVQKTADKMIELQGPLIHSYQICPRCQHKVSKRGKTSCEIHSLTTDHVIEVQRFRCPECNWTSSDSIKNIYGTDTHTSLTKLQAELGCSYSYRKVVDILKLLSSGSVRPVNNKERIKRTLRDVGDIIGEYYNRETSETETPEEVGELIIHVDGAHVATQEKDKRSFEVMTGTIYKPEDVRAVNTNENIITQKTCIASAKDDNQETMKRMLLNAAKICGMTKKTNIIAFSDGASNCQSVINALSNHCGKLELILDWFHIGMKFKNILSILPDTMKEELESAKWKLWHGLKTDCFEKLDLLIDQIAEEKMKGKLIKLKHYLENNKDSLINYDERKNKQQPFTSHVAESTVENLVNSRYRQTGKMQWLREGTHALLQVKCAHYSRSFNKIWNFVKPRLIQNLI